MGKRFTVHGSRFIGIFIMAAMLMSCAMMSPERKVYNVLYASAVTYDTALRYAAEQYKAGKLTEDQKTRVIELAKKYRLAVKTGESGLAIYMKAVKDGDKTEMSGARAAMNTAAVAVQEAQKLLTEYIEALE